MDTCTETESLPTAAGLVAAAVPIWLGVRAGLGRETVALAIRRGAEVSLHETT